MARGATGALGGGGGGRGGRGLWRDAGGCGRGRGGELGIGCGLRPGFRGGERREIGGGWRASGGIVVYVRAGSSAGISRGGAGRRGDVWVGTVLAWGRRGGDDGVAVGWD